METHPVKTDGLLVGHNSSHASLILQTLWSNASLTVGFDYKTFMAYPFCFKASCLMALQSVISRNVTPFATLIIKYDLIM